MKKDRFSELIRALFRYNFRTLFLFELFFKLAAYGFFTPFLLWMTELAIKKAGLRYLSAGTVGRFLASPFTWAALVLILVLFACYVVADMTAVMVCVDCARRGEYVKGQTLIWEALKAVGRLFYWRNLPMLLLVLILLPVLSISFLTGYVTSVQLPDFLANAFFSFLREYWILLVALALFMTAAFRFVYGIFYYVLEKKNFAASCRKSHYLIYGAYFRDLLRLFLWQLLCYFMYLLVVALLILAIIGVSSLFRRMEFIYALMLSAIDWMMNAVTVFFSCITLPLSAVFLSHMFYRNKRLIGESEHTVLFPTREHALSPRRKRTVMLLSILLLIVLNIRNVQQLAEGALSDSTAIAHRTEITAHRGYSSEYPENTMPAFEAAMDSGADWIELDVQETADGEIVVMHDSNLKRTAGTDRNIWEVSYEELRDMDVGRWRGEEFAGTGISTLAEVMERCRGHSRLNIEIKPTGHENGIVEKVLALIGEYDYAGDCVVASMSYEVLEEVKRQNSEIETVYVMRSAYGHFADLEYADNFSVRNNYINAHMVEAVHVQGKEIYAWTVNTTQAMDKMLRLGVDNLITDQPVKAQGMVFEAENSTILNRYIRMLTKWFRWKPG